MFMNHSKKSEVSKVVDDQDGLIADSVLEKRPKTATTAKKIIGTRF